MIINNITAEWLTSGKHVKILDGIAGAAKTSKTVSELQGAGIPYMHTTSTNRLKRDIEERFHHKAQTTASALFHTVDGVFYQNEKDVDAPVIIIDEILQTDSRVFKWIETHKDDRYIIVCTDSKQMLTPHTGEYLLNNFVQFKRADYVDAESLVYSYRPINDETRALYNKAYREDPEGDSLFKMLRNVVEWVPQNMVEYSVDNVYLCHSNEIETEIYDEYGLRNDPRCVRIQKGYLSNKDNANLQKYPVLSQEEAVKTGIRAYVQIANVGSVIRYQGSEVMPDSILYYFMTPGSIPKNREMYTMLTRAKDINSLRFVYWKTKSDIKAPTVYGGLPVVEERTFTLRKGMDDYNQAAYDEKDVFRILREAQGDSRDFVYTKLAKDGHFINPDKIEKGIPKVTMGSLLKRMPELETARPNLILKEIAKYTDARPHCVHGYRQTFFHIQTWYDKDGHSQSYAPYGIDLYSSYPHCWYYGKALDTRSYTLDDSKECKLYVITGGKFFDLGAMITEPLYNYLKQWAPDNIEAECFGSCNYSKDDKVGRYLIEQAYRSKESKAALADIHYGLMERNYLHPVYWPGEFTPGAYYIDGDARYELALTHVQSTQCLAVLKMLHAIYGDLDGFFLYMGDINCDCVYFNLMENDTIESVGKRVKKELPDYDFRIFINDPGKPTSKQARVYQTYKELPSEAEYIKDYKRKKAKEKRREQKEKRSKKD